MEESRGRGAAVAMSGGVDSSVAAYLTLEEGFRCLGVNMRLRRDAEAGGEQARARRDMEDAARAAERLGIPFEVLDYGDAFQECVVDRFIQVYEAGGTPNPCVACTRFC